MWTQPRFSNYDKIKIRDFIENINSQIIESVLGETLYLLEKM